MVRALATILATAALSVLAASDSRADEWMPSGSLRVCADANLLPYSNDKLEGFENKIAQMIGDDLKLPVTYFWWPQTIGFVRNTLRARQCDLVVGAAAGEDLMQNTNPYYRSTYVLVTRKDSALAGKGLDDPAYKGARIGVVAATPPANLLPRRGILNIAPYQLHVDTRAEQPARQAIEDVASGETEAAAIWGPIAGYYAARQDVPLALTPLPELPGARLQYYISMGIRAGETAWKHWLNDFIVRRQGDIDRLLAEYNIPVVNADGTMRPSPERKAALEPPAVAEPDGYRMDAYRAAVPASLRGAQVASTQEVRALSESGRAVLIDVLPSPPRPSGLAPGSLWLPPTHLSLPGAIWLPNVGYGAPSPEQEALLRRGLDRLTGGNPDRPVVLFCQRDCWMSWNAAKRAVEWGYRAVHWYPEGTDGWREAGLTLEPVAPHEDFPS
ncbi:quinoprotein dehydrogenase-associated putative ABC transporter substrate-binding protein [Arenibaculum pallidiluteum]|uniref:quinoprotein dehydrogenase-associated putative ABC transporter substrate-binding protein n=1 Tax=Arenibaculum pallidiluteum TaxID=2812559 RepID=UPI001A97362E|nr:quinoprotein dehydrogenase-associated putative ABC transporter substrate-binding protein [Arenibaculum pallidiluteum]